MRCVNIDWLEVYCEESNDRYPCNADYFRRMGYYVKEREYGTRIYKEMFVIEDEAGNAMIEVRRNPAAGDSDFTGLSQFSTHIRLTNWVCYRQDCVQLLRDFLVKNNYIFHRIYRIDICYDFEQFDSGDKPSRVAKRIMEKTYLKINQGRISAHGADNWARYEWETLSWGSPSSMVSTKMYNKTRELQAQGNKKPYICSQWMQCGLIDNPVTGIKHRELGGDYKPEIWRIEFSIKSKADGWVQLEHQGGKRTEKVRHPHLLSMFDDKDKLWQRFRELAVHYFRFKIKTYKQGRKGVAQYALGKVKAKEERQLQRKDRMPDKVLFNFITDTSFLRLQAIPKPAKPNSQELILRNRLLKFMSEHFDPKVRAACQTILDTIDVREMYHFTSDYQLWQLKAIQGAIQLKMAGDERDTADIISELEKLYKEDAIW